MTVKVAVAVPPAVEVALTESVMSPDQSGGGVRVREARPSKSVPARVQVPSPLSPPADSTAPSGTPPMIKDAISPVPGTVADMDSVIAVSSAPETTETPSTGSSLAGSSGAGSSAGGSSGAGSSAGGSSAGGSSVAGTVSSSRLSSVEEVSASSSGAGAGAGSPGAGMGAPSRGGGWV